jgi:hypothetical protein
MASANESVRFCRILPPISTMGRGCIRWHLLAPKRVHSGLKWYTGGTRKCAYQIHSNRGLPVRHRLAQTVLRLPADAGTEPPCPSLGGCDQMSAPITAAARRRLRWGLDRARLHADQTSRLRDPAFSPAARRRVALVEGQRRASSSSTSIRRAAASDGHRSPCCRSGLFPGASRWRSRAARTARWHSRSR